MRSWVGVLLAVGCYHPSPPAGAPCAAGDVCPPGLSCVGGYCESGDVPTDVPLSVDAPLDACGALTCTDDVLAGCDVITTCTYGCVPTGVPHCARIKPSNGLEWSSVPSPAGTLILAAGSYTFDTTAGALADATGPLALPPGVSTTTVNGIRVIALGELELEDAAVLTVSGTLPLAVLADGDITVGSGAVIALVGGCVGGAFDPTCAGPGGGHGGRTMADPALGCSPGGQGGQNAFGQSEAGGGGGGFGDIGGNGGGNQPNQGPRGIACGTPNLEPLIGGSGGGAGGIRAVSGIPQGGRGGGAGGAVQLTASGSLIIGGAIDAAGAGGENGHWNGLDTQNGGGGGGGAGGGVLLEAGVLEILGSVTANGGGGGGNTTAATGGNGQNGRRDRSCATGGVASTLHGPGGRGGCAQQSSDNAGVGDDRGGGGGGVGRIRLNARSLQIGMATISPAETSSSPPVE